MPTLAGGPNAVWIFQIAGNLTVAGAAKLILSGGAQPKNYLASRRRRGSGPGNNLAVGWNHYLSGGDQPANRRFDQRQAVGTNRGHPGRQQRHRPNHTTLAAQLRADCARARWQCDPGSNQHAGPRGDVSVFDQSCPLDQSLDHDPKFQPLGDQRHYGIGCCDALLSGVYP